MIKNKISLSQIYPIQIWLFIYHEKSWFTAYRNKGKKIEIYPVKLKVCIVDDHAVVRSGLKSLINSLPEIECGWELENGSELLHLINQRILPDIIILDSSMPVMSGIDLLNNLANHPIIERVIFLTYQISKEEKEKIESLGVKKIISKSANAEEIIQALQYFIERDTDIKIKKNRPNITNRELEFIQLICHDQEYTYDQIAEIMGVHNRTIDSFRKSLFQKLQIKSKSGLVLYAIKNGLYK